MPERNVILNFLTRGDMDTRNTMRVISREANTLDGKNVKLDIGAKDDSVKKKFVEVDLMGKRLEKRIYKARIGLEGDKEANLQLDKFAFKIKKVTDRKYEAKIGLDGYQKMMLELRSADLALDRFGRKHETATVSVHKSLLSRLMGSGGGFSPGGRGGGGIGGSGGFGALAPGGARAITALADPAVIGPLAALAAGLAPALSGLGIGALVGGGGAFGALAAGSAGSAKLQADQKAVAAARASLDAAHRSVIQAQGSPHNRGLGGALARQQTAETKFAGDLQQQQRDKAVFGGVAPLGPQLKVLENTGLRTFAKAVEPLAKALGPIMKQIGAFIRSEGPQLSRMFQASIPFIRMFVSMFEQAGKLLIPQFTRTMRQLAPFLPEITKGVVGLVKGFVAFLQIIGPSMKGSAQALEVTLKVIGGVIAGLGLVIHFIINDFKLAWATVSGFAKFFAGLFTGNFSAAGHAIMGILKAIGNVFVGLWHDVKKIFEAMGVSTKNWNRDIKHAFENVLHDLHNWFFDVWHFVNGIWQKTWDFIKNAPERTSRAVGHVLTRFASDIHNWFFDAWHFINGIWQKVWDFVRDNFTSHVHAVMRVFGAFKNDIHNWFFDVWHFINGIWQRVWDYVRARAVTGWHDVMAVFGHLRNDVHNWFFDIWHFINGLWDKVWTWVSKRVEAGWHVVSGFVKNMWHDVTGFFGRLKADIGHIWFQTWLDIQTVAANSINAVIHVINDFIHLINKAVSLIPGLNFKIGDIPTLGVPGNQGTAHLKAADGAWVPGHGGPRADDKIAMVSSGERILSHREIARMGGAGAVDAMAGGRGTGGPFAFAGGGTVPTGGSQPRFGPHPTPGDFTSLLHDIRKAAVGPAVAGVHALANTADALITKITGASGITGMVGGISVDLVKKITAVVVGALQGLGGGGGGTSGLKNPYRKIKGLAPERIDMGVDFGGTGPIYAIGPGVIGQTMNSGWPGGAFIEEKLTGSPYAGKFVYQAENIRPRVHKGQKVDVNTIIGTMTGGIEAGWGAGTGGLTMAAKLSQQAHHGDPGGNKTAMGMNFEQLLVALGVPKAPNFAGRSVGKVPPGFYSKNAGGIGTATAGSAIHNGKAIYDYLRVKLFGGNKIAAAGAIASIYGESGWNPESQGTGGRGLIGWTPPGTLPNSAFTGNATHDLNAQLPQIIAFVNRSGDQGAISAMKRSKTILAAATIWDKQVERAGIFDVHGAGLSLARKIMAMKHGGMITEPIFGIGRSGQRYSFGEDGVHERVTPVRSGSGGGGDTYITFEIAPLGDPHKQAKAIHEVLRNYKKTAKGGQKLGLD